MIRVDIDHGHWTNQVHKLSHLMKQSLQETLRGEAKLFVRDCIKATPPFTPGKNWTESLAAQRRVGMDAVLGDVKRLFRPAGSWGKLSGDKPLATEVSGLVKAGKMDEAQTVLDRNGIRVSGIVKRATPEFHRSKRDKRGRIKNKVPFMVHDGRAQEFDATHRKKGQRPDERSIRAVVLKAQKMVGTAKSGWTKAAKALGLSVPGWISGKRGSSTGIYIEQGQGLKYSVTVGNPVPYVQGTARELRIMQWAQKNRLRNLEKRIAMIMRKRKVSS